MQDNFRKESEEYKAKVYNLWKDKNDSDIEKEEHRMKVSQLEHQMQILM